MMTFKSLGLSDRVLRGVLEAGYSSPTPIQARAIPPAAEGRDLIGCAQTGTGKTAAFVLPMLDRLTDTGRRRDGAQTHTANGRSDDERHAPQRTTPNSSGGGSRHGIRPRSQGNGRDGADNGSGGRSQEHSTSRSHVHHRKVRALLVAPTRELAVQIDESIATYGRYVDVRSTAIYGGVGIAQQFRALKHGVDIVTATPGRLLDHLDRGTIDLSDVEVLVVDEADRMFDMGFIRDIRKIVAATPRARQTLLFSATMPDAVRELAREILTKPVHVEVGERRDPAEGVIQQVCMVRQDRKMELLFHVLKTEPVENVLVFSRTKHRADRIVKKLGQQGFSATVMHSNRSQNQRQRALDGFKSGRFSIMVATDIAARGIDVDGITHVINFDTPGQAEDYIHRIGRTGRADALGDAITFVAGDEHQLLRDIERHTGRKLSRKVYPEFAGMEGPAPVPTGNGAPSGNRAPTGNGAPTGGRRYGRSTGRGRGRSGGRRF